MSYADFLARKAILDPPIGLDIVPESPSAMFLFQRDITAWALDVRSRGDLLSLAESAA